MSAKPAFPWYGGKTLSAPAIWRALGDVTNYVEPFAGGLGALLARPGGAGKVETVNDRDAFIANFWRAVQRHSAEVARVVDYPVSEADLHARHRWLIGQLPLVERLIEDPDWCDPQIAGWWCWGLCQWIGTGWTSRARRQVPFLSGYGMGVHAVTYKPALFDSLRERLRRVRVACGDWRRVLGASTIGTSPSSSMRPTGILLDPPYGESDDGFYRVDGAGIAAQVAAWAAEHGDHPRLRIVLCGAVGDYEMPSDWRIVEGKSSGANSGKERLWLSPHYLGGDS